jgi:hypothetical protein
MKRVLLMLLLAATLLIAPPAGFAGTPFDDIASNQALSDIESVYEKGIMLGTSDNKFNPAPTTNARLFFNFIASASQTYNRHSSIEIYNAVLI